MFKFYCKYEESEVIRISLPLTAECEIGQLTAVSTTMMQKVTNKKCFDDCISILFYFILFIWHLPVTTGFIPLQRRLRYYEQRGFMSDGVDDTIFYDCACLRYASCHQHSEPIWDATVCSLYRPTVWRRLQVRRPMAQTPSVRFAVNCGFVAV